MEVRIDTKQRSDVVLKTVLRQIRRHYLHLFNTTTNYISKKRGKSPDFYREHLKSFVEIITANDNGLKAKYFGKGYKSEHSSLKKFGINGFNGDLLIFLGSMFYPKDMTAALKAAGSRDYRTKVELIHKTLYSFSYINLHHLFVRSPPFRYIIDMAL